VQTHPIVLGTAGHIDHGKTALVRALTGIDTDRLKVEKERGITTELGFAHLDLGDRRFGLVDVPGHERFIKSMVAGAGGLDLVCLVIAADEGVMPQTQEHLDICELLGVRRGVVALTKRDLVDDDWITLVTDDVRQRLAGTFLADAAIVPLSARSGAGLDELRAELVRLTDDLPTRDAAGPFRLPLDRVFTIHGFGTVVTGTALSGAVALGDTVIVHPRGLTAKVRGLEVHGEHVERATAGMRCAVNLTGVAREDLRRGDMLSHPEAIEPSHIVDATFRYLGTSRSPLPRRSRVLLHHATAQLMATVVLADRDQLQPGEEALVQLRLDATTPLAALPGDRFIARGFVVQEHYGTTIGGGEIVRVHAPKVKRSSADAAAAIALIADARGDDRVGLEVRGSKVAGIGLAELGRRLGIADDELTERLGRLVEAGDVAVAGEGSAAVYMHAESIARLEQTALDAVEAFHAHNPEREGVGREELRGRLPRSVPPRIYELLLEALGRRGAIEVVRDLVQKKRGRAAGPAIGKREQQILDRYRAWGVEAPRLKELPAELAMSDKEVRGALDRLLGATALVRIKSDYYIAADTADELRTRLLAHLDAHGQITPAEWKDITGASRKFSIPLAEHFDAEKLTLRIGDIRKRRG
jgi:selenocysteine-specific elongation factor